ncbi:MAG: DUF3224 domain-containing protein [Chloroflexota bacterium]|nr:DUF3224 domain-containing protein [Chloroflexota bacterium]
MNNTAIGTFDVTLTPQAAETETTNPAVGRMKIDKRFYGDLDATAAGQMLTALTAVEGSASYSAIEQVSGTLHGRSGTFLLQHTGIMTRGERSLTITVVPDSGTGELADIFGAMAITIDNAGHHYQFSYTLP